MRYLILTIAIFLSFGLNTRAQEFQWSQTFPGEGGHKSVHFCNENSGWIVGDFGRIYHSTDGGYTWINQDIDRSFNLISVFSIDSNKAFCLSEYGAVFKTTNRGTDWEQIQNFNNDLTFFTNIFLIDSNTSWIFATEISDVESELVFPVTYHTTDGWTSWEKKTVDKPGVYVRGGQVFGDQVLLIYGNLAIDPQSNRDLTGIILSSTDEGNSWTELLNDTLIHDVDAISYINSSQTWAVGDYFPSDFDYGQRQIIKTTDGGQSWEVPTVPENVNGYQDLFFVDQNVGWIGGYQKIIETRDGGASWSEYVIPDVRNFRSLFFLSDTIGWALDGLYVLKYETNKPPRSFGLAKPEDNSIISDYDQYFEWELSTNSPNDPTFYDLVIYNEVQDTMISDISGNSHYFRGGDFFVEERYYLWTVHARDNKYSTRATDAFTLKFGTSTTLETASYQDRPSYALQQNFPNPFNSNTSIRYSIKHQSQVRIHIFDITGKLIASYIQPEKPAGEYTFSFNASDLPSGVYIYQIQAGTYIKSRKMLLIR